MINTNQSLLYKIVIHDNVFVSPMIFENTRELFTSPAGTWGDVNHSVKPISTTKIGLPFG